MRRAFLTIVVASQILLFGGSYPEVSAQTQQNTTVMGTCDCPGFNVTATPIPPPALPAGACGYQLSISQTYPTTGTVHTPRGIRITTQSPVTLQSVTSLTGMIQVPATVPNGATTVQWNSSTALPNGAGSQLLAGIILNANGVTPQQVLVEWLDEDGVTMCRATLSLECPCRATTAKPDNAKLCAGQTTTIKLNPPPQTGSLVTWYKANAPCPLPIPAIGTPTTGWQLAQTGGNTCNTNTLSQSVCYQAVIKEGPNCTYTSTVASVNVGQLVNLGTLTPQPICKQGTNTFTITDPFLVAHPNLVSWQDPTGATVATGVITFTTPVLTALTPAECPTHVYNYKVTIADSGCGPQSQNLPITVYHESQAGSLQASPAGPLCYKQATKINLPTHCGVVAWEKSTDGGTTWLPIPEAGTTTDYWTPELLVTTMFRVTVTNGICPPVRQTINVVVKPKLAVTLSSSANVLCPGPITLTAAASYTPVTYEWYRNGSPMVPLTTTVPTRSITQPGNYRVVVSDGPCGKAKSNVVRIYKQPVVVISGPCGICQGGSIALSAIVIPGDPSCAYTFNWSGNPGGWTGTGQTVTVSPNLAPGASITYTVTATCGGCTVKARQIVTRCPP